MILPKDSLKKIVKIMEYVEENHEKIVEEDIRKEFGEDSFFLFKRYCLGSGEPYAESKTVNMDGQNIGGEIVLTQRGLRKLYQLRGILAEEKRANWIKCATMVMAIGVIIQAIILFFSVGGCQNCF